MWLKIFKFILGILFIPFCFGGSIGLYRQITNIPAPSTSQFSFLLGVVLYTLIHIFIYKPQRIYTFGHEIIHALLSWISGGKVKSIKVSKEGGEVKTDKVNFITLIGPYIIPLYPLLFSLVFFVLNASYRLDDAYFRIFLFVMGFSLSMHILMTAEVLRKIQPDLIKAGYLFSITFIYLINIIIIAFVLSRIFEAFYFKDFIISSYEFTRDIFLRIYYQLFSV
jgi:hypothetical protein